MSLTRGPDPIPSLTTTNHTTTNHATRPQLPPSLPVSLASLWLSPPIPRAPLSLPILNLLPTAPLLPPQDPLTLTPLLLRLPRRSSNHERPRSEPPLLDHLDEQPEHIRQPPLSRPQPDVRAPPVSGCYDYESERPKYTWVGGAELFGPQEQYLGDWTPFPDAEPWKYRG